MKILLIYQPGFAGHFLSYLLSLDSSTYFLKPTDLHIEDTLDNRLKTYSFNNAKKFEHWGQFHRATQVNVEDVETKKTFIHSVHPYEIEVDDDLLEFDKKLIVNLSYSDFANYWIVESKLRWKNFPILRPSEFEQEQYIRATEKLIEVKLDKFLDEESWYDEYCQISNLLDIPVVSRAEELFQSWYDIRVRPLKEQFNCLSSTTIYNQTRLALEQGKIVEMNNIELGRIYKDGVPDDVKFRMFYNSVRGEDWPDCYSENELIMLPEWIQQEIAMRKDK